MPIPSHLSRRLRETLGAEAGEELVTWIDNVDAMRGDVAELRHQMDLMEARLSALIERRFADAVKLSCIFAFGSWIAAAITAGVLVAALRH
jgi:hypothetical protein